MFVYVAHLPLWNIASVFQPLCLRDLLDVFILIIVFFDPAVVFQASGALGCKHKTRKT